MAQNIIDTIQSRDDLSTFYRAIDECGMADQLQSGGPYTVVAPTDDAFNQMDQDVRDQLFDSNNRSDLKDFVQHHIFDSEMKSSDFQTGSSVTTMSGDSLSVEERGGSTYLGDAQVTSADVSCSNGVIHMTNDMVYKPQQIAGGSRLP